MNELQQIKTKILSLKGSIESFIGKNLRINTERFRQYLYNRDPEIVEYTKLIIKTLSNLKYQLQKEYANCLQKNGESNEKTNFNFLCFLY